jgi:hypothetical protein
VSFARLRAADWVAMVAALALLLVMALDWYSTEAGKEARRVEGFTQAQGAEGGEVERTVDERAKEAAESAERNAWGADAAIDGLILVALLATVGLALAAGFLRAAHRRFDPPLTPSALAGVAAGIAALLVLYRMVQEPGLDDANTVEAGPPLALAVLGVLAYASARAVRAEDAGTAFRELAPEPEERPAEERERQRALREQQRREQTAPPA